ncbi:unnamed protein product [Cuscuta campestris]|uniref:Reverse transcriptase domain-containing protein n=1 Tax=Cuscuta campestris TaxID=132261 RepID=A0A484LUI7_9ASTE|nr:unnamed protein product [Cuscuta campestris]
MEFGFGIMGSSGNGISSEIPVETSSVAMVVPSSPLPFGASVGAATMTSFSMPSSIFGSAPRPIPGLKTTWDHPVARSPQPNEANDPLVAMVNQAWYHNNYLAINIILEGLGDSMYPVYAGATLAKELWNSLNKKYQAEDAGTKKFIVGKMLDYKMVDNKSVVAQAEELTVIFNKCNEEKVGEAFQVAAIIHKLPRSWEDFQADLKLKRTELNLEQLLTRLRIREEGLARRNGGAKANVVEHPSGSSHGGKDKKKMCPKGGVSKFAGKCYNCGITGHRSSDCRKKKPQKGKKKTTEAMCAELDNLDLCAVVTEVNLVGSNPKEWFVDTGATRHIFSNRSMFHDFQETSGNKWLREKRVDPFLSVSVLIEPETSLRYASIIEMAGPGSSFPKSLLSLEIPLDTLYNPIEFSKTLNPSTPSKLTPVSSPIALAVSNPPSIHLTIPAQTSSLSALAAAFVPINTHQDTSKVAPHFLGCSNSDNELESPNWNVNYNSDPDIQPLGNTLHIPSAESEEEWITDRGSEEEENWHLAMNFFSNDADRDLKAPSTFVERALQCGKVRDNGLETTKPGDILKVAVVGDTVFDAHKSPSLDSKDRIEHDAKQLHSSLLLNTYNGEAPSEISSDPHFSSLPRPDLSQEQLESNQIGDPDKQELSLDLSSSLVESDKLEGNIPTEEATQRYNIQYLPLPRVLLSPFAAEFIPLMPNPYAALFNHVEGLGNNISLKDDEFDKFDDGNRVLCNNALEEIRDERDGLILYTHSEGEDKAFNDNSLKPLQIDYSRMFNTPFDLGRDYKGRRIYSPSQIVTRSRAKLLKEGRKKTPIGWEEGTKARNEGLTRLPAFSSIPPPRHDEKRSFSDVIGSSTSIPQPSINSRPITKHKGFPAISFSPAEVKALFAPYEFSHVGRFPKSRPPLPVIKQVLERIGFKHSYTVGVLAPSHVLLTFHNAEDYQRCFSKRLWQIQGYPMHVFKWNPDFHCDEESPIFPIWISLEHLPVHLHDPVALQAIPKIFGKPLMLDAATSSKTRPSVARFCVELDVSGDLPAKFFLDNGGKGLWQPVHYEQVPMFCTDCRKTGHKAGECHQAKNTTPKATQDAPIAAAGRGMHGLFLKLQATQKFLSSWSKSTYGNFFNNVKQAEEACTKAEEEYEGNPNNNTRSSWGEAKAHLIQSCRARWRRQHIHSIRTSQGTQVTTEKEILEAGADYFQDLYSPQPTHNMEHILHHISHTIQAIQNEKLCLLPNPEEIKNAVWDLDSNSCAGPDGFNVTFFRESWDIINEDVTSAVQEFFLGIIPPKAMRTSNIILIPKKEAPASFNDYRPISLTNFSFKIITRILASRLTSVLADIISIEQGGFAPGKDIQDHILLARELIHLLDRKTEGGNLALKLDITKAFDKISWSYIEKCLEHFGFSHRFIRLVMNSIKHSVVSTLINGNPSKSFNPKRGVRQGDPLSPYIFIIAMEGLTRSLNHLHNSGQIRKYNTGRIQTVNHLTFADDVLIFTNGSLPNLKKLRSFLTTFEEATSLHLNHAKSQILSPKPSSNHNKRQANCLGMKVAPLPSLTLVFLSTRGLIEPNTARTCSGKLISSFQAGKCILSPKLAG